jgi:hypothetical protein
MEIDRTFPTQDSIPLRILEQTVQIHCADSAGRQCLLANFGAMLDSNAACPDLEYRVDTKDSAFLVTDAIGCQTHAADLGDLVHNLEKAITVELQRRRSDLLFLHAAAVEFRGQAILMAADAGSGKSTTTWALLHHGFRYMSDELGPIDLENLQVLAYPHALCLKQLPPAPYALPASALQLGRTIHTPTHSMPGPLAPGRLPLGAVFLVRYDPNLAVPALRRLGAAEASARIYLTALNALAHPDRGITATLRITESAPCFMLATADLDETSALIRSTVEQDAQCLSSSC